MGVEGAGRRGKQKKKDHISNLVPDKFNLLITSANAFEFQSKIIIKMNQQNKNVFYSQMLK